MVKNIAFIGRSSLMMNTINYFLDNLEGVSVRFILTGDESPEFDIKKSDFETKAAEVGCDFLYSRYLKDKVTLEKLRSYTDLDVCFSVNYSGIIGEEIISLFNYGIFNVHMGKLPRYRGNATVAWAILNEEPSFVLCAHKMVAGELDSGDIYAKACLENNNKRIGEVYDWMTDQTPLLFLEAYNRLQNKDFKPEIQRKSDLKPMRCFPRNPGDGKIEFKYSAKKIVNLVNASSEPFYGSFCQYRGEELKILRAEQVIIDDEDYCYQPGQIIDFEGSSIIVGCGDSSFLKVTEVEYRGRRGVPVEFISGIRERLL